MSILDQILADRPEDLLNPGPELRDLALNAVKQNLDPLASQFSIFDQIHVDGLDAEQVWVQTQMVIDGAVGKLLGESIPSLLRNGVKRKRSEDSEAENSEEDTAAEEEVQEDEDIELENDSEVSEGGQNYGHGFLDIEAEDEDELDEDEDEVEDEDEDMEEDEDVEEDEEAYNLDDDDDSGKDDDLKITRDMGEVEGENEGDTVQGLDKGLFKLQEFQQQVLDLEKDQSDSEDIDYFADPDQQDSEFEEDEDIKYNDFFAPPTRKKGRFQFRDKPRKTDVSRSSDPEFQGLDLEAKNDTIETAMDSVRKDLFADDDSAGSDLDDEKHGQNGEKLSTFEKQQRDIAKEIEKFEQENVGKKEWAVKGEAKARERPLNSLIPSDLEFERAAKPVPVITQEVTESLEDLIRRRIKSSDFDDLPRRLPENLELRAPRKLDDVQETKSQKSLADLYEEDHIKENNADTYKSESTAKLEQAQTDVIDLYASISHTLDALSSWTYKPKPAKASISIVTNVSSISMEDAQPAAASSESLLAPQEIYNPKSGNGDRSELVGHNGLPVSKSEMTRDEKKRLRRRQKAKSKAKVEKRVIVKPANGSDRPSKANIIDTLKKGNVTIIGSKGEKRDVGGNLKKQATKEEASNLKL